MSADYQTLALDSEDEVLWVSLDRTHVMNAFDLTQWRELRQVIEEAETDAAVRVVVIRGAGSHFSAGYDLSAAMEALDASPKTWRDYIEVGNETCWTVWRSDKPVIAAVDGYCLGGAFELVMACDFVMATEDARFGEPEIRFSDAPPFLIAPWALGMRRAKDLLLTGDVIDAGTAERWNVITRVCGKDGLESEVRRLARKLAGFAPETWGQNKRALNRCVELQGLAEGVALGADAFAIANTTPNAVKDEFLDRVSRDGFARAARAMQRRYDAD